MHPSSTSGLNLRAAFQSRKVRNSHSKGSPTLCLLIVLKETKGMPYASSSASVTSLFRAVTRIACPRSSIRRIKFLNTCTCAGCRISMRTLIVPHRISDDQQRQQREPIVDGKAQHIPCSRSLGGDADQGIEVNADRLLNPEPAYRDGQQRRDRLEAADRND